MMMMMIKMMVNFIYHTFFNEAATPKVLKKRPASGGKLPFPGDPGANDPPVPLSLGGSDWKIYTAFTSSAYRCKRTTELTDKAFSWRTKTPKEAWDEAMKYMAQ